MRSLAAGAVFAFTLLVGRAANAQVDITINGNGVDVSPSPFVQDGRVFVPLRGVFQHLGAHVVYANGQINATDRDRDVSLNIGSTQATVDGQPETIDDAPFIIGASTYVPLRFVSQALGAGVNWDENDRTVEISMQGVPEYQASAEQNDEDGDWVDAPPPPIPYYELPAVQEANEIWIPGYWAWGEAGYYWVPGFWAQPPQPDYYWTPGYWAANGGDYMWHQGYWGTSVGFYGGINYGAGYYGQGYVGGRWSGKTFRYNTAVTPVNRTHIKNVYVDRTVVNNTTGNRVSYNGPGGVQTRATNAELAAARAPHRPMTTQQQQHVRVASQDRRSLATVNAGKPPVVAAPRAYTQAAKPAGLIPVRSTDRAAAQKLVARPAAAPARPASVQPAHAAVPGRVARPAAQAPVARPAAQAPVVHAAPAAAPARPAYVPPVHAAPAAPVVRAAPAAPVVRPAASMPVYVHHAPPIAAAPAVRQAAPVMRAPAAAPMVRQAAPQSAAQRAAPAQARPARAPGPPH